LHGSRFQIRDMSSRIEDGDLLAIETILSKTRCGWIGNRW
jgi:hypothetical protein